MSESKLILQATAGLQNGLGVGVASSAGPALKFDDTIVGTQFYVATGAHAVFRDREGGEKDEAYSQYHVQVGHKVITVGNEHVRISPLWGYQRNRRYEDESGWVKGAEIAVRFPSLRTSLYDDSALTLSFMVSVPDRLNHTFVHTGVGVSW